MNNKNGINKNTLRWWVTLVIVFVVYNVFVFAIPFNRTTIFYISYAFTVVALALQIYVVKTAFYKGHELKSKFYGFPIARIGGIYLIAQLVLCFIFMAVNTVIPVWLAVVVYVLLLGAVAIGLIASDAVRDEVERQDTSLRQNMSTMRSLQAKAKALATKSNDNAIQKLFEQFRYSDPVSNEALFEVEQKLSDIMDELSVAVDSGKNFDVLCSRAALLLEERNQLCKITKK